MEEQHHFQKRAVRRATFRGAQQLPFPVASRTCRGGAPLAHLIEIALYFRYVPQNHFHPGRRSPAAFYCGHLWAPGCLPTHCSGVYNGCRVTGSFQTKGYHTFFLNGKSNARYDVDALTQVEPAAELPQAAPKRVARGASHGGGKGLGDYLRKDDYLRKSAHSTELTVRRGERVSHWAGPAAPHQ